MSLPVLYSFRRCPYAMRARLAVAISGQRCELREVVLRDKPQALLEASPKATVPVLVLPDGQVIEESLDIMLWALRLNDPHHWLNPEREELSAMLALIAECDQEFKLHLDRYKYPQRYADEPLPESAGQRLAHATGAIESDGGATTEADAEEAKHKSRSLFHRSAGSEWLLLKLESRLTSQPYLFGGRPALADMAIAPFVRQFAHVDKQWFDAQAWPGLSEWLEAWMASELFAGVMSKYRQWTPESEPTLFP